MLRVRAQRAEELEAVARWAVVLHSGRDAGELHLWTECRVERFRAERPRVQRTRHEFPERIEFGERRPARIVAVRRAVVHVRGDPHDVPDAILLEETQQIRDLELASA